MTNCFIYSPGCQKLKQEVTSPLPHKVISNIFFFQVPTTGQAAFMDTDINAMETSIFQNPFNCAIEELPPSFQLKVTNL